MPCAYRYTVQDYACEQVIVITCKSIEIDKNMNLIQYMIIKYKSYDLYDSKF